MNDTMTITVKDVYNEINRFAPFDTGADWDNPGLLIGDENAAVTRAVVALDVTAEELAQAHRVGAHLVGVGEAYAVNPAVRSDEEAVNVELLRAGVHEGPHHHLRVVLVGAAQKRA